MAQSQSTLRTLVALLTVAAAVVPAHARAQATLGSPTAVFPEDFGAIQTVRELPDGRVLVADPLSNALFAVDMDAGTRTVIGREGEGPEEYMQPDAVWALPGGATLLVDLGNGRLTTLNADLDFVDTRPIASGDPRPGGDAPLLIAIPAAVDAAGNIYTRAVGMGMRGAIPDSAGVLRLSQQGVDTVAMVKPQETTRSESGGANDRNVSISPIPLSPEDSWGVAADGSVVLVRSLDYHVDWVGTDGTMVRGAPRPLDLVEIGTPEKEEFLAAQGRSGGDLGISVSISNGEMQMGFERGAGGGGGREIDQYEWPDRKPPIYAGRVVVDPLSRAWVQRHVDAGDPSTYDVFDRTGSLVRTITLDHGKRVVGFGGDSVYVVAYDEFDLNYLERYALPS
jgi:hypothetical protein